MQTGHPSFDTSMLRFEQGTRLFEFNFLPSRYIHGHHARAVLPPPWADRLAHGSLSNAVHQWLSAYLLERFALDQDWTYRADTLALRVALLPPALLDRLQSRLALTLASKTIRTCVTRQAVRQLDAVLTKDEWDSAFAAATLPCPPVAGLADALLTAPRLTLDWLGWHSLRQLTADLDKAAQGRFALKRVAHDVKAPAPLQNGPALDGTVLALLCNVLLDELET